jgi:hypothetical protein
VPPGLSAAAFVNSRDYAVLFGGSLGLPEQVFRAALMIAVRKSGLSIRVNARSDSCISPALAKHLLGARCEAAVSSRHFRRSITFELDTQASPAMSKFLQKDYARDFAPRANRPQPNGYRGLNLIERGPAALSGS